MFCFNYNMNTSKKLKIKCTRHNKINQQTNLNLKMFFTKHNKPAKIFPVTETGEDDSVSTDVLSEQEEEFDIEKEINIQYDCDYEADYTYNNKTMCYIDEFLSQLVISNIMDKLLHENAYCNEFGVIDLSNIDEYEIDLFEIDVETSQKTYGFKVSPKDCMIMSGSMYDGIISTHCNHDVDNWLPLFHPTLEMEPKQDWYIFASVSFSL